MVKASAPSRRVRMPSTCAGSTSSKMAQEESKASSDNKLMPEGQDTQKLGQRPKKGNTYLKGSR